MSKEMSFDVLVVGGGPAGMAAAVRAAECGVSVAIADDNPRLGGQIWRGEFENATSRETGRWFSRQQAAGVALLCGMRVFHRPEPGVLLAETADDLYELRYEKLVLATGARERFLPFPGWTLPNVMGAGGLQAMVKCGLPIRGKRVVVAGTGPLLLAVAASLRKHGAEIPIICEQASWRSLAGFGMALLCQPGKIAQGLGFKGELAGVAFATSTWPLAAYGRRTIENVAVCQRGKTRTIPCDYLACGFHLVPNIELPSLLGCRIEGGFVEVNDSQETSVSSVFCAGEPTGIGGVELAVVEGQIAGLVAAGRAEQAREHFRERAKLRRFASALEKAFRLRPELKGLSSPDTLVCRCEDVSYSRLRQHTSWRSAKLQTRCGMGPCQGRVCGPATQFLFQWDPDSVRPPIFPTRIESLIAGHAEPELMETTGGRA